MGKICSRAAAKAPDVIILITANIVICHLIIGLIEPADIINLDASSKLIFR